MQLVPVPGDDEIVTVAHASYRLDDFALIIFDNLDPLEVLQLCR